MDEQNSNNPNWETPSALKDMPELQFWEVSFVNAFYSLTSSRQVGMGIGPKPYSEITNYCSFWGEPDPEVFIQVIQKCDNAYLDEYNKEQESKTPKKKMRSV